MNTLKKITSFGSLALVGMMVVGALALAFPAEAAAYGGPSDQAPLVSYGPLSESEVSALQEALDEEYKAWAAYDQVIADLGALNPFSNIRRSEAQHIDALVTLFERYDLDVPENPYVGELPSVNSFAEAIALGAEIEIEDIDLYDELLQQVDNGDLIRVFQNLQWASTNRHLPALQRYQ